MSFNEVKKLRKEGRLEEALEVAKTDLGINFEDIWNKRSIAWVYYEYLKLAQQQNSKKEILLQLNNISKLKLPATEKMVYDSCSWVIGKFLFANNKLETSFLEHIFRQIENFEFSKPSDSYSFLIKSFKKHSSDWIHFADFVDWWGLNNFQPKDYENFVLDNGNKIPSLVEGVFIAISKQLLISNDLTKIEVFIPKIAAVSKEYNNMQYPPYYYARLLLAKGDKKHFMQAFLPFAKRKQRDFWVWDLMSDNFEKNSDEYFSCLCKALTCGSPEKFIGGVREKIAKLFILKENYAEAKYEFQQIIKTREKEGWNLRGKHFGWQKFSWWSTTESTKSNFKYYNSNVSVAESLLYADRPEEIIVIERVNKEKQVLNFVHSQNKSGFFSYRGLKIKPKIGDVLTVRFDKKEDVKSNYYKALSVRVTEEIPSKEIYKEVQGKLTIREGNSFGFVNNVFVSPQIIKQYELENNQVIKTKALNTYNNKRKSWGWNVILIKE